VGTPYSSRTLNYHLRFEVIDGALEALVLKKFVNETLAGKLGGLGKELRFNDTDYVSFREIGPSGEQQPFWVDQLGSLTGRSTQKNILNHIVRRSKAIFPGNTVFLSDNSPIMAVPCIGPE
jgi:hypothetical protein